MRRLLDLVVEALGTNVVDTMEQPERVRHARSAITICTACAAGFSLFNLAMPQTRLLGWAELLSVVVFFGPAALALRDSRLIQRAEWLLLLGALFISSALIVFGGVAGTGLFWVYSVPFLCFFIKGQRRGWYFSTAFFVCHCVCVLWIIPRYDWAYAYPPEVRIHFMLSMGFYVMVAAAFNHARTRFEFQLQQRKSEAEAANLAKSRFLAAASHDLRQPAHALGLFVARLNQLSQDAATRSVVAGVDASVQALQDMLNAFFDYSRLDSQLTQASISSFALEPLFAKLRISFADTAQAKGLRLRVRPTRAWVLSDPVLLHRVLLNLLGNALQHTRSGTVLLACRPGRVPGTVCIQVRDSGVGIAPAHHKKVFEEFYQVENPERDRSKGLGLGLSIVDRSCQLLGHRLTLRSALGCGSTFAVEVPLGQQAGAEADLPLQAPEHIPDVQGLCVLLIEDDVLGRNALRELLQGWGCRVLEARSAEEALAQCADAGAPDFIVSDYRLLGNATGVHAVQQVRASLGLPIPACVVSGDTHAEVTQRVADAGLVLLKKPVPPAKLRSVLRRAGSSQRQVQGTAGLQ